MRKTKKNIEDAIGVVFDQRDRIATLERELAEARKQADLLLWVNGNAGKQLQEFGDEVNSRGARIVDLQERLAMALEALKPQRCGEGDDWYTPPCEQARKALTATAASVAQHTASVERRGAARLQQRVAAWVRSRIGDEHMQPKERAMRLLEEACELAQAHGIPQESVVKQIAHVFGRPTGQPSQEAAGVAVCLLGWCEATEQNVLDLAVAEIERIEAKPISQIRGSVARKADADLVVCVDRAAELEGS